MRTQISLLSILSLSLAFSPVSAGNVFSDNAQWAASADTLALHPPDTSAPATDTLAFGQGETVAFQPTPVAYDSLAIAGMMQQEQKKTNDLIRFADGVVHTMIAPVRWKGEDWLKVGGVLAGTALVSLADKPVRSFWQDRDSKAWDAVERAGFHYGKPYAAFIMTGGFYATGLVLNNEWAKETGVVLAAAYLTSGAIQTIMKTAIGRARPQTNVGPWEFKPGSPEGAYHSFPSGHIQIAMVSAMVLGQRVDNPYLKAALYATGGVTLVSRMYVDAHWVSDMAFGAAISWFCTKAVLNRMDANRYNNPLKKNQVAWTFSPTFNGLGLVGKF